MESESSGHNSRASSESLERIHTFALKTSMGKIRDHSPPPAVYSALDAYQEATPKSKLETGGDSVVKSDP